MRSFVQYSAADAGYGATDKFLLRALQRSECQWISVTTSDNAYGSEVVQRVMAHRGDAPMLQVPLDSKRYFDQCTLISVLNSFVMSRTYDCSPFLFLHFFCV